MLMGTVVYGGSLEFVLAILLLGAFAPLSAFLMALMIQARHLFYGLAMLERYKGYGLRSVYMIYAMSDETFSITCSAEPPEGVDREPAYSIFIRFVMSWPFCTVPSEI